MAEFVGCYSGGLGEPSCVYAEPDGNTFSVLVCASFLVKEICEEMGAFYATFDPYDANLRELNLGRQFIITPEKTIEKEKNGIPRIDWIRPSAIRLDTRPGVPRNTQVLPYQTLEGTVECVENPNFQMYFTNSKHQRYSLHRKMFYGTNGDFMATFCPDVPGYREDGRPGPYRLQGDIVYNEDESGIPRFEVVRPAWKKNKKGQWRKVRLPWPYDKE
ncbi:hypothetical protein [Desulfovibrio cuneatus]|uniref:hypothetical protein n=1 Tax=Desulfovibrio cuneatus TaxID=159728 RepID=UPI0012EB3575|nr:hypothetical protein [Desulfovibrio cuneatus]